MSTITKLLLMTAIISAYAPAFANDEPASWEKWGATKADCPFQATFFRLKGFPFAKLVVSNEAQAVPMVLESELACRTESFSTAFPRSQQIPTYVVTITDLCQGSLPKLSVSIFLSGVTKQCEME